jgi:hypothetical protein
MKQHILNQKNPNCMSCHIEFNREFVDLNMTKTFRTKELPLHRENVLVEREKSLLIETVEHAEAIVRRRAMEKECKELESQKYALYAQLNAIDARIRQKRNDFYAAEATNGASASTSKTKKERKTFIKACVVSGCRGFLSSQYKCGICETWVCPHCHEVKQSQKDENHTCNPDMVESVKMIAKETKPCPKCAAAISKVSGCFAQDTPILLWNGETKMSQDVKIGDVLVGDDGLPRNVLHLFSGEDELYEVSQNKGVNYIVNSKHTLVLKMSGDRSIYWESSGFWVLMWFNHDERRVQKKKERPHANETNEDALKRLEKFRETIRFPLEIQMTVEEYMSLDNNVKSRLLGFRASTIQWEKKEVNLEPYMLGLWIGDGINNGLDFASNDKEVLEYLLEWCDGYGAELVHDGPYKFRTRRRLNTNTRLAIGHGCTSGSCKGCLLSGHSSPVCDIPEKKYKTTEITRLTKNPLKEKLEHYNLIKNKHIPMDYVVNDKQTRMEFLAGLADTDGHVPLNEGKRIIIRQTDPNIVSNAVLIARSLGYFVSVSTHKERKSLVINGKQTKGREAFSINISSPSLSELPTRVLRKECFDSTPNKDNYRTSVSVKHIGRGNYFGWAIDYNKKFLLPDMTVVRNCDQMWCTECQTTFSWNSGQEITTSNIHNPHYYEWLRRNNNGEVPRNPLDNPCGGNELPNAGTLMRLYPTSTTFTRIFNLLRCLSHMRDYDVIRNQNNDVVTQNRDLRIKYLLKELDEAVWKKELQQREKKRDFKLAKSQVCEMIIQVGGEFLNQMARSKLHNNKVLEIVNDLEKIVKYYNESMQKVHDRFISKAKAWKIKEDTWVFSSYIE